ncbi:hypothetical protein M6B38_336240 [Iris pallida]|uniref:Uncharacterized protein n=1 Tax=Iris pallida TaxID=29817 RepID=A0AAX6H0Z9_IRIPA|nr:hypothetical protein M6B38_336240 [Iris pallida]
MVRWLENAESKALFGSRKGKDINSLLLWLGLKDLKPEHLCPLVFTNGHSNKFSIWENLATLEVRNLGNFWNWKGRNIYKYVHTKRFFFFFFACIPLEYAKFSGYPKILITCIFLKNVSFLHF